MQMNKQINHKEVFQSAIKLMDRSVKLGTSRSGKASCVKEQWFVGQ